jgi:DNA modification methylase
MAKRKFKAAAQSGIRDRVVALRRVRAGDLLANPKNWRTHPEPQREAMRGVLAEIGYADALLARETPAGLELIDGHLRQSLDPEQVVPVLVLDLSEAEAAKLLLTLDPLAGMAEANSAALAKLLAEVDSEIPAVQALLDELAKDNGIDLSGEPMADPEPQIDRAAELQKVWGTAAGQVWEIPGKAGVHRVVCGDCRELLPGVADNSVAMIFTDPPYGHNNNDDGDLIERREAALGKPKTKSSAARPIANDGPEANELLRAILPDLRRVLVPGGCCCCCCGGGGPDPQFARWSLWIDEVIPFKMCVVWDKGGLGMGWHYRRCWECVLVAGKPGAACKWYGGNSEPNIIRDVGKIIPNADQHPTEKPPALAARFIGYHSLPGEVVYDPLLGSGSTLIAAEQLGRVCYGMEISPGYVAVILQRAADAGLKPALSGAQKPKRNSQRPRASHRA